MDVAPDPQAAEPEPTGRNALAWLWRGGLIASALILMAIAALWIGREPIANSFIADELARRGVAGSYRIDALGLTVQRISDLRIGNPAAPDLTADWAEIETRVGLSGVHVLALRAGGVRVSGRLAGGKLTFGAIDRLLPKPTGVPFRLPDMELGLSDVQARIATDAGPVMLRLNGSGNPARRMTATLSAAAPQLIAAGCRLVDARGGWSVTVTGYRPQIEGPLRFESLACPQQRVAIVGADLAVSAKLSEGFDAWSGEAKPRIGGGRYGEQLIAGIGGRIGFEGTRERTEGMATLEARAIRAGGVTGETLTVQGPYYLGQSRDGLNTGFTGQLRLARASIGAQGQAVLRETAATLATTPLGPLAAAFAKAAAAAGRQASGGARVAYDQRGPAGTLVISDADLASASGFRARIDGGSGIRIGWPDGGGSRIDARMRFGGGGMPAGTIALAQTSAGAPMTGTAIVQPYRARDARLALAPVRFFADPSGNSRFATRVTLDGPIGDDGGVAGLSLPLAGQIAANGAFALDPGCAPLSFHSLMIAGAVFEPAALRLCPASGPRLLMRSTTGTISGGARIAAPQLAGRIGDQPLGIAATQIRLSLANPGFAIDRLAVSLGGADDRTRLAMETLTGRFAAGALTGGFNGLSGKLAAVPLLADAGAGDWRFADGVLSLTGSVQIADADALPRFNPLTSNDFTLKLADGRITAGGGFNEPRSGIGITRVAIRHDLGSGTGDALLDVPGIVFGEALQPERLTRLTLGVIANVRGAVAGSGRIAWTRDGVTSTGEFATSDMALAAAFGPVTGLTGAIRFTDLIGLVTAPGQTVRLATVNPGIEVTNGVIHYQLIGNQQMQIEDGRWPFSGGELVLAPGVLDLGEKQARRLTFKVIGLDAGTFIQRFDFKDIYLTGTFDGTLPMVFDADGGRIENGRLVVRRGGGQLSYVGQLSNEDLGVFGKIAFDALKAIRYDRLAIEMDGALDGEMVSRIVFNGVNRGEGQTAVRGITGQFIGLPFIFNVTIKAPFRQLITTAQGLYDPNVLIQQRLPELLRENRKPAEQPVQRPESE